MGVALHLFHLLGVVPFFFYIATARASMPEAVFYFLIVLASVLILVHSYKAFVRIRSGSTYFWVNLVHVLIVAPLLLFIGIKGKTTPRAAYEGLLLVTFGALGYHLKLLAEDLAVPYAPVYASST